MASPPNDRVARQPLSFHRVQRSRMKGQSLLTVFCSRAMEVIDLRECRTCEHGRGLSIDRDGPDIFQRCAWTRSSQWPPASAAGATVAAVSTIMTAPAVTISERADLRMVAALFIGHMIGALPVVDASGKAVGIVTKGDVLRAYYEHEEQSAQEVAPEAQACNVVRTQAPSVREVMSHVVFALQPEADVTRAAAIMAHEGVHHVVVVNPDGTALGIVSALDVMAWLARASGYVIAKS
jgi:CBS domain-containing protein